MMVRPSLEARVRAFSNIAGAKSRPIAFFTCGGKEQATRPPPHASSSRVSVGCGFPAFTTKASAAASTIGLASLNPIA